MNIKHGLTKQRLPLLGIYIAIAFLFFTTACSNSPRIPLNTSQLPTFNKADILEIAEKTNPGTILDDENYEALFDAEYQGNGTWIVEKNIRHKRSHSVRFTFHAIFYESNQTMVWEEKTNTQPTIVIPTTMNTTTPSPTVNANTLTLTAITPGSALPPGNVITTITPTFQWSGPVTDYSTIFIWGWMNNSWQVIYNSPQIFGNTFVLPSGVLGEGEQYRWILSAGIYNSIYNSNVLYFQTPIFQPSTTIPEPPASTNNLPTPSFSTDANGFSILINHIPPYNLKGWSLTPENISTAGDPTFSQMVAFLIQDRTDEIDWVPTKFESDSYAIAVHDNAEKAGIRCALVYVEYKDNTARFLNAFNTTDKGLVFIDCSGQSAETKTLSQFLNFDKVAYIALNQEYGIITLYYVDSNNWTNSYSSFDSYQHTLEATPNARIWQNHGIVTSVVIFW